MVHLASRLGLFSMIFETRKYFFAQNDSERFNSWKKVVEIEIWEFRPPQWVPGSQTVIFCRFSKMKTWSIFSTLADWICLILHIMIVLIAINHLTSINYLAGWHNIGKCGQLCVKKFKISIFDQFFDFHGLKRLANARYDSLNGSWLLDYHK